MSEKAITKRSGIRVMCELIHLIFPLIGIMMITISMGILGFLVAIFITVLGAVGILTILDIPISVLFNQLNITIILLLSFAVARGILRYLEQYSGHFIAFKLLALIRDLLYQALRNLAPAKLDNKTSGKLISIITADVEQLEVFYAHTIAPIIIAILTSGIMIALIWTLSPILAIIAFVAYVLVGFVVPYITTAQSRDFGREYRENVGNINTVFLENLYGMREILSFNQEKNRQLLMEQKSNLANQSVEQLKKHQGITKAWTETVILFMSMIMLFTGMYLTQIGTLSFNEFLVSIIALMSSYGPVVTLSNLSNNLLQTFASGERVLNLLQEKPLIEENINGSEVSSPKIDIKNISFAYDTENILEDINIDMPSCGIIGIVGKSGSGKSTLLKLLMRFYDVNQGNILFNNIELQKILTRNIRENISYVTQTTFIFNSTIEENIRIAKRNATMDEIVEACKKACIHDFIMTLPQQYQSKTGELGDMLSGGEQQRLGLARAFLHSSSVMLLDEPTSNLDSLNESIILTSLKEHSKDKLIVLVSHRTSTLSICDTVYRFQSGRMS